MALARSMLRHMSLEVRHQRASDSPMRTSDDVILLIADDLCFATGTFCVACALTCRRKAGAKVAGFALRLKAFAFHPGLLASAEESPPL